MGSFYKCDSDRIKPRDMYTMTTAKQFQMKPLNGPMAETKTALPQKIMLTRMVSHIGDSKASRPRHTFSCYLCGQQYGRCGFLLHISRCEKKWVARENLIPEAERRPIPERPQELARLPEETKEIAVFNLKMLKHWEAHNLITCQTCNRKFKPESYGSHKKNCTKENPGKFLGFKLKRSPKIPRGKEEEEEKMADPGFKELKRVKSFACYLCGRDFGSKSLLIHIPQCQKKWKAGESLKKSKKERRALPKMPAELDDPLPTDMDEIDKFNERMVALWNSASLVPCPQCNRTFRPEALEKHKKGCVPDGPIGRDLPGCVMTGMDFSEVEGKAKTYMCYLCGREYGSKSLFIHIPNCKKKWENHEAQKCKKERRRLPPIPAELDDPLPTDPDAIESFNKTMFDVWNKASLISCPTCKRTFREEAFEKHRKGCGDQSTGPRLAGIAGFGMSGRSSYDLDKEKPRAFCCYICGRQYGSKSLLIHAAQCRVKFEKFEELKPKCDRRAIPEKPSELEDPLPTEPAAIDAFNEIMFNIYNDETLVSCENCGRTFRPDALEKHRKGCAPAKTARKKRVDPEDSASKLTPLMEKGPKAYVCYLCGRQYGSKSLMIHTAQCQMKFEKREAKKPASERRCVPERPSELDDPLPTDPAAMSAFNEKMSAIYNFKALVSCDTCGRTFWPEALEKHKKGCMPSTKDGSKKPAYNPEDSVSKIIPSVERGPKAYVCYLCGRQYGSKSLGIHLTQCLSKWENFEAKKLASERRTAPTRPKELDEELPADLDGIAAFNEKMTTIYNTRALVQCGSCGRTFWPEALAKHQKSCKK
ncbi:hypothetical protein BSKO_09439 [Bryopsis sp. KO-2023]|nr:hypothetical protein BSKO_09439 [Bryopsis sp. KO-2023]